MSEGATGTTHGTGFTQDNYNVPNGFMTEHLIQGAHTSSAGSFTATSAGENWISAVMALTAAATDTLMGAMML